MISPSAQLFFLMVILSVISPVSEKFRLISGIFFMGMYVYLGAKMTKSTCIKYGALPPLKEESSLLSVLIVSVLLFLHTDFIVRYYTGQDLNDVIYNLGAGISNYNLYQSHFREEGVSSFEPIKIYFAIWLAVIKIVAFYAIYSTIISKSRPAYFLILVAPFVLYSMGRGTSVEILEVILFILSALHVYYINIPRRAKLKIIIYSIIFAIVGLYAFNYNISSRFNFEDAGVICAGPFCFQENHSPDATDILLIYLSSYLISGLVNINSFIMQNGLILLFPFNSMGLSVGMDIICNTGNADCGAWNPVLISFASHLGFLLLPALYLMGRFFLWYSRRIDGQFDYIMAYFIFNYFTFSLFVGEGLFASSANLFILMYMGFKLIWRHKMRS